MNAFYSPFLHFSWSFDILEGSAEDIDDLYVYFQTASDGTWSEDKCVRYSEYATVVHPFADSENTPQGTFLNMYLNGKWGRDSGGSNRVTRLKFVLRAKKDTQVRARLYFNFIRADFDDRMSDNCGQYISAAKHYLSYTQDAEFLAQVLPVARRAMQFYLTCLDGAENGIISNAYLVGHFNSGTAGVGVGIGDGFWDPDQPFDVVEVGVRQEPAADPAAQRKHQIFQPLRLGPGAAVDPDDVSLPFQNKPHALQRSGGRDHEQTVAVEHITLLRSRFCSCRRAR